MGLCKSAECKTCTKYALLLFFTVVVASGIVLIVISDGVFTDLMAYEFFLVSYFFWLPKLLIIMGSIVIGISLFGFWGTLKESYCLIMTISVLLFLIFLLELSAGIAGYILASDVDVLMKDSLSDSIKEYNSSRPNEATGNWDYLQKTFSCCGIESYKDWTSLLNDKLPLSCCHIPTGAVDNFSCTISVEDPNRHFLGCLADFSTYINYNVVRLAETAIIIAALQFFGVIFVCYIARKIKNRNDMIEHMG